MIEDPGQYMNVEVEQDVPLEAHVAVFRLTSIKSTTPGGLPHEKFNDVFGA